MITHFGNRSIDIILRTSEMSLSSCAIALGGIAGLALDLNRLCNIHFHIRTVCINASQSPMEYNNPRTRQPYRDEFRTKSPSGAQNPSKHKFSLVSIL